MKFNEKQIKDVNGLMTSKYKNIPLYENVIDKNNTAHKINPVGGVI